jgi:hypothetical protein
MKPRVGGANTVVYKEGSAMFDEGAGSQFGYRLA